MEDETMTKKFDAEAVRREIDRLMTDSDGRFDMTAMWAATKVKESALHGVVNDPNDLFEFLEKVYGEDNVGYYRTATNHFGMGHVRRVN
jgi:hypothetical protein